MKRPYEDDSGVPYENPLNGCKGIITGIVFSLLLIFVLFLLVSIAEAKQTCNYYNGGLSGVPDVLLGNINHCNERAEIQLVGCNVRITAFEDNYFFIREHPEGLLLHDVFVPEGSQYTFNITEGMRFVEVFTDYGIVGIIDYPAEPCIQDDFVYPDDDRLNWQQGDYYAKVYLTGNHLQVYDVTTGTGILILNVDTTYQQVVCSFNICVFVFEDSIQVNITDAEGKFYEIIVLI